MDTIKYKGYEIKIDNDELAESPRTAWDNMGTMVCFHRNYRLGDENHGFSDPDELLSYLKKNEKDLIAFPLRLYDHSGISISMSNSYPYNDRWDSMLVGFIFITKEKIRNEYSVKTVTKKIRERVTECLQGEVDIYDDFLRGSVYHYSIEDKDGNPLDSCGGFYGYDHEKSGLMEYAKNAIDSHIHSERQKHFEQLKAWIRSKVSFEYRTPCLA